MTHPPTPGSQPAGGIRALPVRRSYAVDRDGLQGLVVEIDPTGDLHALAVLQAGLHP